MAGTDIRREPRIASRLTTYTNGSVTSPKGVHLLSLKGEDSRKLRLLSLEGED